MREEVLLGLVRGWSPELLEEEMAGALVIAAVDPDAPFFNDKQAEGMALTEDVSEPTEFSTENLGDMQVFGDDKPFMVGGVVDRVLPMSPKLEQRHCEYLLAHPDTIT